MRRLLWILLDNALKYTQGPGRIDVALSANSRQATVEVRDSGMGISAVDLPHIFERFYRADPSRSNIDEAGLGLAFAKWIAEMHHADLFVDSVQQEGSSSSRIPTRRSGTVCLNILGELFRSDRESIGEHRPMHSVSLGCARLSGLLLKNALAMTQRLAEAS